MRLPYLTIYNILVTFKQVEKFGRMALRIPRNYLCLLGLFVFSFLVILTKYKVFKYILKFNKLFLKNQLKEVNFVSNNLKIMIYQIT